MRILLATSVLFWFSACGLDSEMPSERELDDAYLDVNESECRKSRTRGCIQGQVPAAPEIYVEDQRFFDANDLGQRFASLVEVKDENGQKRDEGSYEFKLINEINNESFPKGFEVFVKGESAQHQDILRSGGFAVHYLRAGFYDVRVQKRIKFSTNLVAAKEAEGDDEDEPTETTEEDTVEAKPENEERVFCATLFADSSVEVQNGYRTGTLVFDRFSLHLKDQACDAESSGENGAVTL